VETILHFCQGISGRTHRYRQARPLPFLKRWLGCKTLAEKLILKARGVTIVVVDTALNRKMKHLNKGENYYF